MRRGNRSLHVYEFTGARIKAGLGWLHVVKTYYFFQHEKTVKINTSR